MTRTGKIARLPREIRDQLNRRLHDGEPGTQLVLWLNSLSEVQAVMAAEFGARPVNEQNLTEWKQGGYRDWLAQQEAIELVQRMSAEANELKELAGAELTDNLALWIAARYAVASKTLAAENGKLDWKLLREMCNDIVSLRRGDHYAARLKFEREQLEFDREQLRKLREEEFWAWAKRHDIREKLCHNYIPYDERLDRARKAVFGVLVEDPPVPAVPDESEGAESNQIKPDQTNSG